MKLLDVRVLGMPTLRVLLMRLVRVLRMLAALRRAHRGLGELAGEGES